ncbi:unnamed protein product [Cylicocyclus nassatus]|uniref:Uncharacterized protein n=1 Tax=Cylicocyclus nassatus TaxID=53992 RepID=A0AA36MEN0_CYLNA|nr:unnamed protein product [Cylicocyclus nassatus]
MMSGWRAFRSVIIIHRRVFEQGIREHQLEIQHVRPLLEAAERGRGLPDIESSGAEPGPSKAIADLWVAPFTNTAIPEQMSAVWYSP